jgi:predicted ABC-type sugar transport system permease subunit
MHASSALVNNRDRRTAACNQARLDRKYAGHAAAAPIIGRTTMKNPLDSLWGTIICGLILTLILHNIVSYALGG